MCSAGGHNRGHKAIAEEILQTTAIHVEKKTVNGVLGEKNSSPFFADRKIWGVNLFTIYMKKKEKYQMDSIQNVPLCQML